MSFEQLGLSDELLRAVSEAGYDTPTPIQKQAIPPVLMGRDVLGIAQTGTGKTASFVLPMLDVLAQGRARARMPRSLILEPTRELAAQVAENFEKYGKYYNLTMALIIGGVSFGDQQKLLDRGVDVLIATPGRLLDQFERRNVMLNGVDILVIDEADRMMDMGFIPDVEKICTLLGQRHQTLFFSATMPPTIKRLTDKFLTDPKMIEVARPAQTASTVKQSFVEVSQRGKTAELRAILDADPDATSIVFCNRKRDVSTLEKSLKKFGFRVGELHGDMDQSSRTACLERFKGGDINVLAASDVAARGLDIPAVSLVVNFNVPIHPDDYVHRIGRTGRAGRSGRAITFVAPDDAEKWADVTKLIGIKVDKADAKDGAATAPHVPEADNASQDADAAPQSDTPKTGTRSPRRASSGRSRSRKKPDAPEASDSPAVAAEPEKTAAPTRQRKDSAGKPSTAKKRRNPRRDDGNDGVVGLGDHVPAFLQVTIDR